MNRVVYRTFAVALLGCIAAHRYATVRQPPDVRDYHERIRTAHAAVHSHIGPWVGTDSPVPAQAVRVLSPNLLISRRYTNVENGLDAGFLLVHCDDAHDMAGHFPLRCYPAAGWKLKESRPRDWQVGDLRVSGYEYEFTHDSMDGGRGGSRSITVASTLFRPGGRVFPDMASMTRSVVGAGGQSSGAGQLQVYFDRPLSQDQRDAAVVSFLEGHRPVLDAILADVKQ